MMALPLEVYELRFTLAAQTTVHLGVQAGAQIRGALWSALERFACTDPAQQGQYPHSLYCPMCRLMALEMASARGVNPPRPFVIRPPLMARPQDERLFEAGEQFEIGINLFGDAALLFPYVCEALNRIGKHGVGYGRGRFAVLGIQEHNALTGACAHLLENRQVHMPQHPITQEQVLAAASALPANRLRLRFLTPTQLITQKRMLQRPDLTALIARLLERCQTLAETYGGSDGVSPNADGSWTALHTRLTQAAQGVAVTYDNTRWIRAYSGSRRANRQQDVSGFVGDVEFTGDVRDLREWLVWGALLHVGKNAVKGNGWYTLLDL